MHQAWNHARNLIKLVFRESQVLFLCISVGAETPHLSSVAHADESAHWLESTGSTGQEVGAVVGLQEADKVGALRLQNTDAWTFIKATGSQRNTGKDAFSIVVVARNNFLHGLNCCADLLTKN